MRVRIIPAVIEPGGTFVAAVELDFKTDTPVDSVRISFAHWETSFQVPRGPLHEQEHVWKPGKLTKGKHVREVRFQVPVGSAPSFRGMATSSSYLLGVHVDIPWWVDREVHFAIPVTTEPTSIAEGPQPLVATSDGPRANELYIELSADRDHVAPGETLSGSVSLANVATKNLQGVEAGFVRRERDRARGFDNVQRWAAPIHRGSSPPEQESIPFRISIPSDATPSFKAASFDVEWRFEVRAITTYGADVVLGFPLRVVRRRPDEPLRARKPYLVGRDRWTAVWEAVAQRTRTTFSAEKQALEAASGKATLELRREVAGANVAIVGRITYPHLGLALNLHEKSLTDLLASRKIALPSGPAAERFVATAREPAQAEKLLVEGLLESLLLFNDVRMSDDELAFSIGRRAGTTAQALTPVVGAAQRTLDWVAKAIERVPPPSAMAAAAPAWEAFARSTGARLEKGRMWIHDGEIGGERFEIGCVWSASELETLVKVHAAPPFDGDFVVDDPSLSPATRECLKTLLGQPGFVGARDAVRWVLPGGVNDPETLRDGLETAAKLIRGRRGLLAAGPFR